MTTRPEKIATLRPVTLWNVYTDKRRFEHNHLEDGHVPYTQTHPTAKFPEQKRAWARQLWGRSHAYLNAEHVVCSAVSGKSK